MTHWTEKKLDDLIDFINKESKTHKCDSIHKRYTAFFCKECNRTHAGDEFRCDFCNENVINGEVRCWKPLIT